LAKTSGELRFHEGITECDVYDYTEGTMRVNGGSFIANDLEDSGIFGNIILSAGDITYHQDADQYIDLRGDLTISDGVFTIYGGDDDSYWPYGVDVSFTMSGGIIDIVDNGIRVNTGPILTENITGGLIKTAHRFRIYRTDFNPTGGTIELYGTTDAELRQEAGSNFYSLEINKFANDYVSNPISRKPRIKEKISDSKASTVTASTNLDINGDFILNTGTFTSPATMNVAGNWTNNMDASFFDEGINLVIFDGAFDQTINKENFYSFELNKSGGEMLVPSGSVNIESFNWTAGAYHVNGGTMIVFDLLDDGLYGDISVSSGKLFLSQGITSGEYIDLNGNLTITGGLMNVYGGSIVSYWPWSYDASITMSDGILDFVDQGIYIYNSSLWSFTDNITGGTIRTPLNLDGNRTDFNPTGGTFELYGPDDAWISMGTGSNLYNLDIEKSGTDSKVKGFTKDLRMGIKAPGTKSNAASLSNDIVINGNLDVQESSFNFNGHLLKVAGDVNIFDNGITTIDSNGELMLGSTSTFLCETGGIIEVFGVPNNNALITSESGYYNFSVTNGGTYSYDFSDGETKVFGGLNGHKMLSPGIYGMFGGDTDANGTINVLDKTLWGDDAAKEGFLQSDFNLDGQVNNQDKNDIQIINDTKQSQIPN